MSRSALNTAGNLAYAAKSIYKMIKAFLRGGWYAAALEALKQYWPQLICVSLAVSLVPVIFFFSLPMFLFGFNDSPDPEMTVFNEKAAAAVRYFDNYTEYYAGFDGITDNDSNTDISVTALSAGVNGESYTGAESGNSIIQKNRFIALYAVSVQNDIDNVSEESIRNFAARTVRVIDTPDTDISVSENTAALNVPVTKPGIRVIFLTPDEIMQNLGFSQFEKDWANLMYNTLEQGGF